MHVKDYIFDIISESDIERPENRPPKHFLADTSEQAVEVYKKHEKLLNSLAYTYSMFTGLSRADLFGEALMGLSKAVRDWNTAKSKGAALKTYAFYKIIAELDEYVRKNSAVVITPFYIKRANANLAKILSICEMYDVDWYDIVIGRNVPDVFIKMDAEAIRKAIDSLTSASERAGVTYNKFIERIRFLPSEIVFSDQQPVEEYDRTQEILEASLVVDKLKEHMTKKEIAICEGIMADKSYSQIGKELGISKTAVSDKLTKLREKIIKKMRAGTM